MLVLALRQPSFHGEISAPMLALFLALASLVKTRLYLSQAFRYL